MLSAETLQLPPASLLQIVDLAEATTTKSSDLTQRVKRPVIWPSGWGMEGEKDDRYNCLVDDLENKGSGTQLFIKNGQAEGRYIPSV